MNCRVFIVLGVFLALFASISDAASINFQRDRLSVVISIDGEIQDGDFLNFRKITVEAFAESTAAYKLLVADLKKNNPKKYSEHLKETGNIGGGVAVTVSLNSNGGSLAEAIKIGEAVREMALETRVADSDEARCTSACFFVWVAGIERSVPNGSDTKRLGIHRIYFNRDQYKGLSSSDAEEEYSKAQNSSVAYLLKMGVPLDIANNAFRTPSNDVYFLTQKEVSSLEGIVPYFDELLIARCGSYSKQEESDYLDCQIIYPRLSQEPFNRMTLSDKNKISRKCNAISSGYMSYLEKTYVKTKRCRKINSDIERWKRMATHLSFSHLIPK